MSKKAIKPKPTKAIEVTKFQLLPALPCPFCGHEEALLHCSGHIDLDGKMEYLYFLRCGKCYCVGPSAWRYDLMVKAWNRRPMSTQAQTAQETLSTIEAFVARVNARAERNMELTHKLEGSHYAAMQAELNLLRKQAEGES